MGTDLRWERWGFYLSGGQLRLAVEKALGIRVWNSQEVQGLEGGRRRKGLVQSPGNEEIQQSDWRTRSHEGQWKPGKPRERAVSRSQQKRAEHYTFLSRGTKQSKF